MNKYNEYISETVHHTDGWWWLAIPVIGWFVAIIVFGFYLPFRYFYDNGRYGGCNCGK